MSTHETVAHWYKSLHSRVISHEFNYSKFSPKRWPILKFLKMSYFKQQLRFSQEWSNIKIDIRTGLETTFLEHSPSGRVTFRFNSPGFVFTRQRQPLPHPHPVKCARFLKPSECKKGISIFTFSFILSKRITHLQTYSFIFLKMEIALGKSGE